MCCSCSDIFPNFDGPLGPAFTKYVSEVCFVALVALDASLEPDDSNTSPCSVLIWAMKLDVLPEKEQGHDIVEGSKI